MSFFYIKDIDVVFCHIPKTGGTSIRKGVWKGKGVSGPVKGSPLPEWNMERSLAFTRNPLDKFISGIRFGIKKGLLSRENPVKEGLEIVENGDIFSPNRRISFMTEHLLPQTHKTLHLDKVKYTGRFENLQEDFNRICIQLAVEVGKLPTLNKTPPRIGIFIPDRLRNRIVEFYYNDYIKLGYSLPVTDS